MALDQKALQKKRAKRELKRKQVRQGASGQSGILSKAREWAAAVRAPIADVLVPASLFEVGIGTVWISRLLPDGRYALAGILVDTYCLGVKNALFKIFEGTEYPGFLDGMQVGSGGELVRQEPAYARKLVEGAIAYAGNLGFAPHPDYRVAGLIFGDIDPAECPVDFTFGLNGRPMYIEGPDDSPAMQRRILTQLGQAMLR
jgi:hypothetical protein